MPLAKYFLVVGGILLTLLFVSNAIFPDVPAAEKPDGDKPVIRIHSDRKWPERVVFDTSLPTIVPPAKTQAQLAAPLPPPAAADGSAKPGSRNALAQLSLRDAHEAAPSDAKKAEAKLQRKRKIARRYGAPPMMMVEQQPRFGFGFFGNSIW
jgi:hypothetical protein